MPCYKPVRARKRPDGSVQVLGSVHEKALLSQSGSFFLPCGRCVGCRLKYTQMWAIRCVHEASLYDQNCVVTFTYRPEDLPASGSLVYRDFQLFMKRLRKHTGPQQKVRYFVGGEYGVSNLRPHFHAVLFNYDWPDKLVSGSRHWTSSLAERMWRLGSVLVGECNFESASYCASYVAKKVYGDLAPLHYRTGTEEELLPEFAHMSQSLGRDWMRLYWSDVSQDLKCVSRGRKVPIPRAYERYLSQLADYPAKKLARQLEVQKLWADNIAPRLLVKQRIASARLGLKRRLL